MATKDGMKKVPQKNEDLMRALRRHRMAVGLSLEALAGRLKVATSTVAAWESGRNLPRAAIVPKLAGVLEVDPLELTKIIAPERVSPGQLVR